MASIIWPASLPAYPELAVYSPEVQDQKIRTSMETGVAKVRRRYTASIMKHPVRITLSASQFETFKTFFNTTTQFGTLPINWDFFGTNDLRFVGVYQYKYITPEIVQVTFTLEELP